MKKLFGTDGIRGLANKYPMTAEVATQIGLAVSYLFRNTTQKHKKILIGKDTRLSCYIFENALAAGICSMGVDTLFVGPMPTPAIAFLTSSMRADAGIVISASHNPFYDNGIKIFSGNGFKLDDEIEYKIEQLLDTDILLNNRPREKEIGKAYRIEDANGRYIVFLKNTFPKTLTLEGIKIVLDCANGAAYKVAPSVFEELGADVIKIGITPDGTNINSNCGALYPELIKSEVIKNRADIGIAFDGDADRLIVVDEKGNIIDGDHILAICANNLKIKNKLNKNTVVSTVMSNIGLEIFLKENGIKLLRTKVGDRYVVESMKNNDYNLGGEQSGHIIFLDHNTTGDGILAALQLLGIMISNEKPISELAASMKSLPQILHNIKTSKKTDLSTIEGLPKIEKKVLKELGKNSRILIRNSGTEPLIRIMVEGENEDKIKHAVNILTEYIKSNCL